MDVLDQLIQLEQKRPKRGCGSFVNWPEKHSHTKPGPASFIITLQTLPQTSPLFLSQCLTSMCLRAAVTFLKACHLPPPSPSWHCPTRTLNIQMDSSLSYLLPFTTYLPIKITSCITSEAQEYSFICWS